MRRLIISAFDSQNMITMNDIIYTFAVHNLPLAYQHLCVTIEITKTKMDIEELFASVCREESSQIFIHYATDIYSSNFLILLSDDYHSN
jgi:hypothetical protein